jgi:hypothetical protein
MAEKTVRSLGHILKIGCFFLGNDYLEKAGNLNPFNIIF